MLWLNVAIAAEVYTFSPITPLGIIPDCTADGMDVARAMLDLHDEYPVARMYNLLKTMGVQKLLMKYYQAPVDTEKALTDVEDIYAVSDEPVEELIPSGNGTRAGNDMVTLWGESMGKAVAGILGNATVLDQSYGNGGESAPSHYSPNYREYYRSLFKNGALVPDGLNYVNNEGTGENEGFNVRRLSSSDSVLENLVVHAVQLASSSSQAAANNSVDNVLADVKFNRFLNGALVQFVLNGLVKRVKLDMGNDVKISMTSPMKNLGDVLCGGAVDSRTKDPEYFAVDTCALQGVLRHVLACRDGGVEKKPDCEDSGVYRSMQTSCPTYDQTMDDTLEVNISIASNSDRNDTNSVSKEQGNMDRWLYNAAGILYRYAEYESSCGVDVSEYNFLPGWTAIASSALRFEVAGTRKPAAVLLRSNTKLCEFIAVFRGTSTLEDWMIDFQTELIDIRINSTLGRAHAGFTNIAAPTAAYFSKSIKTIAENTGCSDRSIRLTTTGHSLGGGVSLVAALLFTEWLPHARVAAVGFAAPRALDAEAAALLKERVQVRNWVTEFDAVPRMPCSAHIRCAAATGSVNQTIDEYADNPNEIMITAEEIGKLVPKFLVGDYGRVVYNIVKNNADMTGFQVPGPALVAESHSCAYACWLNSHYCYEDGVSSIKRACRSCYT